MDKSKARIQSMFSEIASFYDLGNSVLSLGMHYFWKKELIKKASENNPRMVLDLCCGTGDIYFGLLKKSINCIALDFTIPMLKVLANRQSIGFADKPEKITAADALSLPFSDSIFSSVTVSYGVRNFESLQQGLKEILRVLEPGGKLLILEFGQAPAGVMGTLVKFYESKVVPLIGSLVFSSSKAYSYLSESAEAFPSREEFNKIALQTGFKKAEYKALCFGASYLYTIEK